MRKIAVPIMRPQLASLVKVNEYLSQTYSNGIFTNNGPLIRKLEENYAKYFEVDPELVVCSSSATIALEGATSLSEASHFHCPAYTFPASALAVLRAGKSLSFHDIDLESFQMKLEEIPNNSDHGLMYVLPFGASAINVNLYSFKSVVIDAAASIGNKSLNIKDLPHSWVVVFSLHATKVLGIGEGGISIFGNKNAADTYRAWINFGFSGTRNSDYSGTNGKLSEISASFGLAALDLVEIEFEEWQRSRDLTNKLEDSLKLNSFSRKLSGHNPYWIVNLKSNEEKIETTEKLTNAEIQYRDWWSKGCHKMAAFRSFTEGMEFPITDMVANQTLGLPFFRGMSEEQAEAIHECLS